jgi:hypothetical protein
MTIPIASVTTATTQTTHPKDSFPELTRRYEVDWLGVLGMMPLFLALSPSRAMNRPR